MAFANFNDFMDDLSEDWISEPRSSSPSSSPSQLHSSKRKSILSERSQNHSNIQANPVQRAHNGLSRRSVSDASTSSQGHFDTTARKSVSVSPPKSRKQEDMPEWRRRLLQGERGYGEQMDLFSPIAIEGIFQKPVPRGSVSFRKQQQDKPKGLSFLKSFENIPSSPPPWPQMIAPQPKPPSRFGTVNSNMLSALDEEDEDSKHSGMQEDPNSVEHSQLSSIAPTQQSSRAVSYGSVVRKDGTTARKVSFDSVRLQPSSRKASDTASWNLTQNSDDFSPVFISKHNTADGRIAYAALDLSKSELEERLKRLRESEQSRMSSLSQSAPPAASIGDETSFARLESENLPEDLPVGTPDVADIASIGEFVSIKRGGYSEMGSFKRRPLSPSPLARPISASPDESSMLRPNAVDLEISGIPPAVPTPPLSAAPKTPHTDRNQDLLSPQRARLSNSPLKLFENHDTFTANRLQRRISQLEEPELDDITEHRASPSRRATGDLSAVEETSFVGAASNEAKIPTQRQSSIQQYFGHGDYDDHTFPEDQFTSSPRSSDAGPDLPSRSPSPDMMPPGYQQPFRFHVDEPPPDFIDTFKDKRRPSKGSTNGGLSVAKRSDRSNRPRLAVLTDTRLPSQPSQISQVSEGKRPLTPSPFKSPTPKRRRTVLHNEFTFEAEEMRATLTHDSHASFQNALSRKRKDARYGSERNLADPDILAQRSILRPRNPTPSQRRRQEAEDALRQAQAEGSSSPRLEAIQQQLSQPPLPGESAESVQVRALATHLAVISEDVGIRKKSVTTQDYLDDAMKVMHFIRTQYKPNSNLTSLNEQDSAMLNALEESLDFPDATDDLSLERPPSREGRPASGWRTGKVDHVDPRVVSHLCRFQEDEEDAFMTASSRSSQARVPGNEAAAAYIETVTSDPPGLQIIGQSFAFQARSRTRSDSNSSNKAHDSSGTNGTKGSKQTHSSRTSIDSTMGRTTNSRKSTSENVATLAPDAVAHLIPEQVAGMTYDKEQGRWVRRKKKAPMINEQSGMTGSDNDPFGDIPDLTVDSMEETKHLLLSRSVGRRQIGVPPEGASALFTDVVSRPSTGNRDMRDLGLSRSPDVNAAKPSLPKMQGLRKQEAASSITDRKRPLPDASPAPDKPLPAVPQKAAPASVSEDEEVEHEFSILEGRAQPTPPPEVRNITVSLSSPAWARSRPGLSPVLESPAVSVRDYGRRPLQATPAFQKRQDHRELNLSVRVSGTVTTQKEQRQEIAHPQVTPCKGGDVTFYLSELPDFTLNQLDERDIPARILSKRNTVGPIFSGSEDRYASGNQLLVHALQDVEPDEPYWEDLRKVDLHGKGLTSLHLLDVLCDRLETLDVSQNELAQLDGAPHTVRSLSVRSNMLTGLTAWGFLFNLQYLDISYNQIDSLEGLAGLVHLRELRADGNRTSTLNGIEHLDGLLTLSLRSNELEEVSFEGCELLRLESLDLGGNSLTTIRGLHCLPALKQLNLDSNHLRRFPQDDKPCSQLHSLDLSRNDFTELDLFTFCPKLQHLDVDSNKLASTEGISQLRHLHKLSMRSQSPSGGICHLGPILEARLPDLHTLSLSENHIPSLCLPHDWYSLRTLELASCGLQGLPDDFGLSVPNLRSLNLNFNAIRDLRPLLNIKSLNELHVAGNRLARLRKTTAVLSKLRALEVLDLRDNPFSIGFHPQAVEKRVVTTEAAIPDSDTLTIPGSEQDQEQAMRFILPPCDRDTDTQYFSRLDEGTRLRRRVYEMLLANNCKQLAELDGLNFVREDVLVKDEIWNRLLLLGVLKKSGKVVEGEEGGSP